MSEFMSTQIQLVSRPTGWPTHENFRTVAVAHDALRPGQVRVRNEFVSVDPYMRGRMNDARPTSRRSARRDLTGAAIGEVVESAADEVPVGRRRAAPARLARHVQAPTPRPSAWSPDVPGVPLSLHLDVLGMTGLTAYVGLTAIAGMREGDTVFVSGAAGAVGTRPARSRSFSGAKRVIGIARAHPRRSRC